MNGIDFLFVAIALVLILIVWSAWDRYRDWSDWDRDRRHERRHHRYEFQDAIEEAQYRRHLRFIFNIRNTTGALIQMNQAMTSTTRAFMNLYGSLNMKKEQS